MGDGPEPTTQGAEEPFCGNGKVETENHEECDDGAHNDNAGACTDACTVARCGDCHVQRGEACDACDGDNVDEIDPDKVPYGGCGACVAVGPYCGDSIVDVVHEDCDPGAPPTDAKCDKETCRFFPRRVFVSSTVHQGDLGIDPADKQCNVLAGNGGLKGTFKAWLLANGSTIYSRFGNYIEPKKIQFLRTDNILLAVGFAALLAGPMQGVTVDESGKPVKDGFRVWTNVQADGGSTSYDCGQWSELKDGDKDRYGLVGFALVGGAGWTQMKPDVEGSKRLCVNKARLYCVQVSE